MLFFNIACNKKLIENCMSSNYYSSSFHKYNNGFSNSQREISTSFSEEDFEQLFKNTNLSCKEVLSKYFYCNICFNSNSEYIISYNGNKIILDSSENIIDFTQSILNIIGNMETGSLEYNDFYNIYP